MSLNYSNKIVDNSHDKIQEVIRILEKAFTSNKKIINGLNEIKTVSGWYKQAGTDPDSISSTIFNKTIEEIVKSVKPHLHKFLIKNIKIETDVSKDNVKIKSMEIIFSIKPYVEYIKKVQELEEKIKITFNVAISGKAENIQVHSSTHGKQITIGKISAPFTLSILKGEISIMDVTINPVTKPIILYHNETFKIQKITFSL